MQGQNKTAPSGQGLEQLKQTEYMARKAAIRTVIPCVAMIIAPVSGFVTAILIVLALF